MKAVQWSVLAAVLILAAVLVCPGCGNAEDPGRTTAAANESTEPTTAAPKKVKADIDLTKLSATMVYSEVYNMTAEPDKYIGKRIRMSGPASVFVAEATGKVYYSCIIKDATACCAQGIEFTLKEGDYPNQGDPIVVEGVFDTYYEGEYRYCTLVDAVRIL